MSGSHFSNSYTKIRSIVEDIECEIDDPSFAFWSFETQEELKNGLYALKKAYIYSRRIDMLLDSDDSEESFHDNLKTDLAELNKCFGCCSEITKSKCKTCGKMTLIQIEEKEYE